MFVVFFFSFSSTTQINLYDFPSTILDQTLFVRSLSSPPLDFTKLVVQFSSPIGTSLSSIFVGKLVTLVPSNKNPAQIYVGTLLSFVPASNALSHAVMRLVGGNDNEKNNNNNQIVLLKVDQNDHTVKVIEDSTAAAHSSLDSANEYKAYKANVELQLAKSSLSSSGSNHTLETAYQFSGLTWSTHYSGILSEDARRLDLDAWFVVRNQTDCSWNNTAVSLVNYSKKEHSGYGGDSSWSLFSFKKRRGSYDGGKKMFSNSASASSSNKYKNSKKASGVEEESEEYQLPQEIVSIPAKSVQRHIYFQKRSLPVIMWNSAMPQIERPESGEIVESDVEENSQNYRLASSLQFKSLLSFRTALQVPVPKGEIIIFRKDADNELGLSRESGTLSGVDPQQQGDDFDDLDDYSSSYKNRKVKSNNNNNGYNNQRNMYGSMGNTAAVLLNNKHIKLCDIVNVSVFKNRTKFRYDARNHTLLESWEVTFKPTEYFTQPINAYVDDILFRSKNWDIETKNVFEKIDDCSIRFKVFVKTGVDTVLNYTVHYRV